MAFIVVLMLIVMALVHINIGIVVIMLLAICMPIMRIYINNLFIAIMIIRIIVRVVCTMISTVISTAMGDQRIMCPMPDRPENMTMSIEPKLYKPSVSM